MQTASPGLADSAGLAAPRTTRMRTWRSLWVQVHLYLGLFIGALLVVFGLTGSILVFWQEIDEWLNPRLLTVTVPPGAQAGAPGYRPIEELLAAAVQAAPPGSRVIQIYGPGSTEGVFAVYAEQPSKAWARIFVDPYRARVTGVRAYGAAEWVPSSFMDVVFALHYTLFMGETGVTLAGIAAVLLTLSLLTGILVWWPRAGQWRQAFVIRRPTNQTRLNFDLHKTVSLYTLVVLGAVLLSGVDMNVNGPYVWMVQLFSPATRGPAQAPTSAPGAGLAAIGAERAVAIAAGTYPDGVLSSVAMPDGETGVYVIGRRHVPGLSAFWSERQVTVDQYSGAILDVRDPMTRRSAGETFLDWQWPLHSGQAFGWTGRVLVFVSGVACPVIYATGFLMWWRKRKARAAGN
ncbi:MAG: PepSY-associated TM helix domain-containing protein [Nitrospira sp.]|nr:PepSY-associated TM helix domain-containing protein [Nitrospira sp.]